ncbi:hypothetical protein CBS101457_005644 [Exobasidium rhododendri]|nr:hypothetical protein CBS101457_005644 [Exobasidium rhododendri]
MEEEDTCRICRSGPEEDTPLYHPCKCSGSIAKVHQDCLIEWLQHSKKKSCELCNTELRFHKVYSPTMPAKLPSYLYVRQFLFQLVHFLRYSLRAIFVSIAWLALLPLGNIYVWRLHFWIVDVIVWGLIGGTPPPGRSRASPSLNNTMHNITSLMNVSDTNSTPTLSYEHINSTVETANIADIGHGMSFPLSTIEKLLIRTGASANYRRAFDTLAHDTFEGQVLTCAVVIFFVAIFLLREWCLQNLPQPVEGLAFAGQAPPLARPNALLGAVGAEGENREDFQAVLEEARRNVRARQFDLGETEQDLQHIAATHIEANNDRNHMERPRLRHGGIPEPPELQRMADNWAQNSARMQGERNSDEEERFDEVEASPLTLEEMRGKRAARFSNMHYSAGAEDEEVVVTYTDGESDDWRDVEDSFPNSPLELDKGKGREEQPVSDTEDAQAGPSNYYEEIVEEHRFQGYNEEGDRHYSDDADEGIALEDDDADRRLQSDEEEDDAGDGEEEGEEDEGGMNDPLEPAMEIAADAEGPVIEPQDWEEVAENGERIEDDLEGMLEAVGLRGPVINLLTNMTMMFVLCSFVLALFIAFPYMIGRLLGVGTNVVKLFNLPIKGLRFFTDPFVDFIINQAKVFFYRVLSLKNSQSLYETTSDSATNSLTQQQYRLFTRFTNALWSPWVAFSYGRNITAAGVGMTQDLIESLVPSTKEAVAISSSQSPNLYDAFQASVLSLIANVEDGIHHSQASVKALFFLAEAKTKGGKQQDKVFCVLLGHFYWLVGLLVQKRLSGFYLRWNLTWLKSTVDQQLVVLKVLSFIVLELAVFPWCCGFLWDVSLFPLWDDVTLSSRLVLLQNSPFSVAFTQWSLGTLYMFGLAQFVSNTRNIVRSGVLCFVRDAGDPNFHPIKDILERKSSEQLRKIGVSAVIYSGILTSTVGVCTRLVYYADRNGAVLPLRWEMHQSLTTTGFEFVAIALFVPHLIKSWLPSHLIQKGVKKWWKLVAHQLRISSYLLGGDHPSERGHYVYKTWKALLMGHKNAYKAAGEEGEEEETEEDGKDVYFVKDGGYGRVPADDHAIMTSPIIIRTDANGEPTTDFGQEAQAKQLEAIEKLTKKPRYTITYLPPNFRLRIYTLFFSLWFTLSSLFVILLLCPMIAGRFMLDAVLPTTPIPLHDGFSWLMGAVTMGAFAQAVKTARRITKSNSRRKRIARIYRRSAEFVWMSIFVSLTSTLLGVTVELYLNGLSIRDFSSSPPKAVTLPEISLAHAWSMGMLLQYVIVCALEMKLGANAQIDWEKVPMTLSAFYAIIELRSTNQRRTRIRLLTRKGFLPAILFYLCAIFAPLLLILTIHSMFGKGSTGRARSLCTSIVFNGCISCIFGGFATQIIQRGTDQWTNLIKDELYLISTQLKNYPSESDRREEDIGDDTNATSADGPIPDALLHR